jgi:acetate kinase
LSSVFVVNCGSSSVKYRVIEPQSGRSLASGSAERIGEPDSPYPDHDVALREILAQGVPGELGAFAHRVVHGGDRFSAPVVIDGSVLAAIRELAALAPLHNPANLRGIEAARAAHPELSHVAIFDTAFHQTLPPHAYTYAVPPEWAAAYGVRRYGFHGTSHAYVSRAAAAVLGRSLTEVNLIVLHLGNGASASAVAGGRCIDTSMGLTPLEGLVMGTRCGDLDPGVVLHMMRVAGLSGDELDAALNKRSGMLALAGDNDMRAVGDDLALDVYCYRLRKYVGAYYAALGRVDAVVFTAGVGENSAPVRAGALAGLERLGIAVDPARNGERSSQARRISPDGSPVAVLVVPTNEELEMARQAAALLAAQR